MARRRAEPPRPVPPPRDLAALTWVTGLTADRSGMGAYTHLIRSPDDPERGDIRLLPEHLRDRRADWHRSLTKTPSSAFRRPLLLLLAEATPRTFNALGVALLDKTADVLLETPPDVALWWLVERGLVEHSMEAPILFRATELGREALVFGEGLLGDEPETPAPSAGGEEEEDHDIDAMGKPAENETP